jgi:hypothetical protein
MIIDRKTGKEITPGDWLIRKDYKGFKHRYEILEFIRPHSVRVRKLTPQDRWVYLQMPLAALQLDDVMI